MPNSDTEVYFLWKNKISSFNRPNKDGNLPNNSLYTMDGVLYSNIEGVKYPLEDDLNREYFKLKADDIEDYNESLSLKVHPNLVGKELLDYITLDIDGTKLPIGWKMMVDPGNRKKKSDPNFEYLGTYKKPYANKLRAKASDGVVPR